MTLISLYNSQGCVGRCDEKCYGAMAGSACTCICGGMNHGAGKRRAMENTRNNLVGQLKDAGRVELAEELQQLSFDV